jgi:hypothetical protein
VTEPVTALGLAAADQAAALAVLAASKAAARTRVAEAAAQRARDAELE